METGINQTLSLCPQLVNAFKNIPPIFNNLTFNDPDMLAKVACEAERLNYLISTANLIVSYIYIFGFFIGTLGGVAALWSYITIKKFNATSFYYYRAMNAFDLIYVISYFCSGFSLYNSTTPVRAGVTLFIKNLTKNCGKSSRLLVSWLAFDRSVACHWPQYYHRIDKKQVARLVIVLCFCITLSYNTPSLYFDILVMFYSGFRPEAAIALFERVFRGFEGLVMLILMPIVLVGFIKMSRRKRILMSDDQSNTPSGKAMLNKINMNKWLCVLQLCEGIPAILNTFVIYISFITNFTGLTRNMNSYLPNSTFEGNLSYQKLFEVQQYFVVIVSLIDAYNHCGHFYTYLLFSPMFRRTLHNVIKRKFYSNHVDTVTAYQMK